MKIKYPVRAEGELVVDEDGRIIATPSWDMDVACGGADQSALALAAEMNRGRVWQPIATAPWGDRLMVRWCPGDRGVACKRSDEKWVNDDMETIQTPTHWMPLPAAPEPEPAPAPEPEKQDEAVDFLREIRDGFKDWTDRVNAHLAAREKGGA